MECLRCGTCCTAPDISTLGKKAGTRCLHLGEGFACRIYPERPKVCRGYRPDEICRRIQAPTLEERVARYLALFGAASEETAAD